MVVNNEKIEGAMQYCGRGFSEQEIEWIRGVVDTEAAISRQQLSIRFCEHVGWHKPDGSLKDMSCRVAFLRMARDGVISLPAPRQHQSRPHEQVRRTLLGEPRPAIYTRAGDLTLEFHVVEKRESLLWNELIDRYHYLGYTPLPGAQMRYFVESQEGLVALLGFSAAAWALVARDRYIGWDRHHRTKNLRFVVNNCRFLILPWVHSKGLASRILARAMKRLAHDWQRRYRYRPVLVETFVERDRFHGTCYKAAGWLCVGETKGRGKLDVYNEYKVPVKTVWLYPLERQFRQRLCGAAT